MFKLLIYFALISLAILLIITVILVIMNWSEKFYSPLLSIGLIGTVTTFITVILMLKDSTIEKSFSAVMVIDDKTNLPPFVVPNDSNEQSNIFSNYFSIARPSESINGIEKVYFAPPKNFEETVTFCEELLQYDIFMTMAEMQRQSIHTAQGNNGVRTSMHKPFKLTKVNKIPFKEYSSILDSNRFSKKESERYTWDYKYFKLPKGTNVLFEKVPSSERTGVEKHKIILQKRYFFKIEITIESFGATGQNAIPTGLEIAPIDAVKTCRTYVFPITLNASFERITAGNWQTEEFKKWVNWMFDNLEQRYSDINKRMVTNN